MTDETPTPATTDTTVAPAGDDTTSTPDAPETAPTDDTTAETDTEPGDEPEDTLPEPPENPTGYRDLALTLARTTAEELAASIALRTAPGGGRGKIDPVHVERLTQRLQAYGLWAIAESGAIPTVTAELIVGTDSPDASAATTSGGSDTFEDPATDATAGSNVPVQTPVRRARKRS